MKRLITVIELGILLGGCATPAVINPMQPQDVGLNCEALVQEMTVAQDHEHIAREERGITPLNIAAGLFFWPALVGTYYNTEEAIVAAETRQQGLQTLFDDQRCADHL